jgi:hypothetical protein
MLSRRDLVGKLAAGTAVVWAAGMARSSFASTPPTRKTTKIPAGEMPASADAGPATSPQPEVDSGPPETLSAPAPWDLIRPLAPGQELKGGWRVAELTGAVAGSCVVTLAHERGRTHRVHICSNDGHPQGLVYTKGLDLVVMNGGQGDLPTEEGLAQAVAELAHVIAANEDGWQRALVADGALMPHAQRVQQFAGGARLR